jgi:DNA polymerase-1
MFNPEEVFFDLETDGLYEEATTIHLLVIKDVATRESRVYRPTYTLHVYKRPAYSLEEGLAVLAAARIVIGHNITAYDCPVLEKLHGLVIPWHRQRDTMTLSRLLWPERKRIDFECRKKGHVWATKMPGQLMGRDSLESWGWRLNCHKGEYEGDSRIEDIAERKRRKWEAWNPDMEDYGVQDVEVTAKLFDRCAKEFLTWARPADNGEHWMNSKCVLLETQTAHIIQRQERYGFLFDEKKAVQLYGVLASRRAELEVEVRKVFKPLYLRDGSPKQSHFVPKKDSKQHGYCANAPLTKIKLSEFNLTSRDHVAYWLKVHYDWKPQQFTNDGKPTIDDDVISALPYAEAAPLKEYFMVSKRIGQVAEGNEGWLKRVKKDGRVHGRVNTNGAVTGRMTHMTPNMGQVPSGKSPYGHECRELWIVPPFKKLVGADADALELRDLAGYMAIYDGGAYIKTVLEGDKSQGTDMHSVNCRALGIDPKVLLYGTETGRDMAKTWFYAFIYGSGDENLGYIQLRVHGGPATNKGKAARAAFLKNLPAMGALVNAVKKAAKERGYLVGLDGRHLNVRSQHGALNTLLQSAGAVQMKKALCILDDSLQAIGLVPGLHYEFVANVHDEWQIEVNEDVAETVGRLAVEAIRAAGVFFGFRCPLDGAYDIGNNWAETH